MESEYLAMFEEYEQNWAWFKNNYQGLLKRFDGEYVAVFGQEVVDHDKDLDKLVRRVKVKYHIGKVLVEFVTSEKLELVL